MRLKKIRILNELTQEQIANKIGITQFTYSNYEKEKTQPAIETLCKLADYYNVSLDYLCEHETKHLIDTSNWLDITKSIVYKLQELSEKNQTILLGYMLHMLKEQNNYKGE